MKKIVAATSAVVAVTGGSLVVASLFPLGIANAQDDTTTTTDAPSTTTEAPADANKPERGEAIKSVLDGLVTNGTLTQAQADAVRDGMAQWRADHPLSERGRGPSRILGAKVDEVAEILGLTTQELRTALAADGATLGSVAGDQVGEVQTFLANGANTRIDEALAAGKLSEETAAGLKAAVPDKIQSMIDGTAKFGEGRGRGHRGGHGPNAVAETEAEAPTTTTE